MYLDKTCSQYIFNYTVIVTYFIPGFCSCTEKVKSNAATHSYDSVIIKWNYYCSLDFANILQTSMMYSCSFESDFLYFLRFKHVMLMALFLCGRFLFLCFISMYFSKCFCIQFQALSFCEQIGNTFQWHCLPIAASLVACHFITSSQTFRLTQNNYFVFFVLLFPRSQKLGYFVSLEIR